MDDKNKLSVPVAIVAAGIIIAGAVFFSRAPSGGSSLSTVSDTPTPPAPAKELTVPSVTASDHILGSPDAKIKLVEYSDLECPACQFFHPILKQVLDQYGKTGEIAWVYRHFPLKTIHPKAPREAEASECVSELGGNQKFWAFVERVFTVSPANNGLDPAELPKIASYVGVNEKLFTSCLNSKKYEAQIEKNYNDAIAMGLGGTPTTFLLLSKPLSDTGLASFQKAVASYVDQYGAPLVFAGNDKQTIQISAAFQFPGMKAIIDATLLAMTQ